jgi:ribosomal protein S18 acetylase RimI-like enzyme
MPITIRPMLPLDLDAVLRVQAACYPPAMQEAREIILQRMTAAHGTCLVCDDAGVAGYLFAYPSRLGRITDLGAPFEIAPDADTLYLHDLAIDPRALGQGLARRLVEACLALAGGKALTRSALVSVQDSARFWHALGYRAEADAPDLSGYPPGAAYMVRTRV